MSLVESLEDVVGDVRTPEADPVKKKNRKKKKKRKRQSSNSDSEPPTAFAKRVKSMSNGKTKRSASNSRVRQLNQSKDDVMEEEEEELLETSSTNKSKKNKEKKDKRERREYVNAVLSKAKGKTELDRKEGEGENDDDIESVGNETPLRTYSKKAGRIAKRVSKKIHNPWIGETKAVHKGIAVQEEEKNQKVAAYLKAKQDQHSKNTRGDGESKTYELFGMVGHFDSKENKHSRNNGCFIVHAKWKPIFLSISGGTIRLSNIPFLKKEQGNVQVLTEDLVIRANEVKVCYINSNSETNFIMICFGNNSRLFRKLAQIPGLEDLTSTTRLGISLKKKMRNPAQRLASFKPKSTSRVEYVRGIDINCVSRMLKENELPFALRNRQFLKDMENPNRFKPVASTSQSKKNKDDGKSSKKKGNTRVDSDDSDVEHPVVTPKSRASRKGNTRSSTKPTRDLFQASVSTRSTRRTRASPVQRYSFPRAELEDIMFLYPFMGGQKSEITVRKADLVRTEDEVYLNDVVIDFYIKYLLLESIPDKLGGAGGDILKGIYVFSSLFFKRMIDAKKQHKRRQGPSKEEAIFAVVQRWARRLDLFSHQLLVAPVNDAFHWSLLFVCNADQLVPLIREKMKHFKEPEVIDADCDEDESPVKQQDSVETPEVDTTKRQQEAKQEHEDEDEEEEENDKTNEKEKEDEESDRDDKEEEDEGDDQIVGLLSEGEDELEEKRRSKFFASKKRSNEKEERSTESLSSNDAKADTEMVGEKQTEDLDKSKRERSTSASSSSTSSSTQSASKANEEVGGDEDEGIAEKSADKDEEDGKAETSGGGRAINKINIYDEKYTLDPTRKPLIITMDSLKAHSPVNIAKIMRAYLKGALIERLGGSVPDSVVREVVDELQLFDAHVPSQLNSYDCGVYVLHFFHHFLLEFLQGRIMMTNLKETVNARFNFANHVIQVQDLRRSIGATMMKLWDQYKEENDKSSSNAESKNNSAVETTVKVDSINSVDSDEDDVIFVNQD